MTAAVLLHAALTIGGTVALVQLARPSFFWIGAALLVLGLLDNLDRTAAVLAGEKS